MFIFYDFFFKDDTPGMVPDPKSMHQRPRQVFSSDGKDFLNLWFLPHYTEIVFSYHLKEPEVFTGIMLVLMVVVGLRVCVLLCVWLKIFRFSDHWVIIF